MSFATWLAFAAASTELTVLSHAPGRGLRVVLPMAAGTGTAFSGRAA